MKDDIILILIFGKAESELGSSRVQPSKLPGNRPAGCSTKPPMHDFCHRRAPTVARARAGAGSTDHSGYWKDDTIGLRNN
jgi:hypothetical protein